MIKTRDVLFLALLVGLTSPLLANPQLTKTTVPNSHMFNLRAPDLCFGSTVPSDSEASRSEGTLRWANQVSSLSDGDLAHRIADENRRPGTTEWAIDPALNHEIEGYATVVSAAAGETVQIAVSTRPAAMYNYKVFRMGYYAGTGARLVAAGGPLPGITQAEPTLDPATGLVEAHWRPSFEIVTQDENAGWLTGVYLVKLIRADGLQSYVIFVLRDDTRDAEVALEVSTATWQAYNYWGGESLYQSESGLGYARKVSFDRPYVLGYGSGTFLYQERPTAVWLEQRGYDVEYTTNLDSGRRDGRVGDHRLYIAAGHYEYGSIDAILRYGQAVERGVSLAFLTGNTLHWQVRYEDSPAGVDRVVVCYREPAEDPFFGIDDLRVTTRFRADPVNRPENELLGVLSSDEAIGVPADWVVQNASHWVYAGTGLSEGDQIRGAVFNEWDTFVDDEHTPVGTVVIAHSPVSLDGSQSVSYHNATIYERGSAFVFAAGSIYFGTSLLTGESSQPLTKIMGNLLTHAGARAYGP